MLMPLALRALIAVDISQKRFMEIVDCSPPTDEEEDLLTWAYALLEMIRRRAPVRWNVIPAYERHVENYTGRDPQIAQGG